jgi:2-polyprenyl-6-methoxyphenol hydroxylase-like FAD-dependent oxidoreductase
LLLSKKGIKIDLFDKRELSFENPEPSNGRSLIFGLMTRCMVVLKKLGVDDEVVQNSEKVRGLSLHIKDGSSMY